MNLRERKQSMHDHFVEVYGRALAAGLWDGREDLPPMDLAARLPPGFFRTAGEAAAFGREWFVAREPAAPCDVRPGSAAKVKALAARVDAGEDLWHPADVGIEAWNEERTRDPMAGGVHDADAEEEESSQGDRERQPGRRKIGGHHTKALAEE